MLDLFSDGGFPFASPPQAWVDIFSDDRWAETFRFVERSAGELAVKEYTRLGSRFLGGASSEAISYAFSRVSSRRPRDPYSIHNSIDALMARIAACGFDLADLSMTHILARGSGARVICGDATQSDATLSNVTADCDAADEEEEEWCAWPQWARVEISSFGRIRRRGVDLDVDDEGYVLLPAGGRRHDNKKHSLARLVAEMFVGRPRSPLAMLEHVDGDEKNCRADNLRWVGAGFPRKVAVAPPPPAPVELAGGFDRDAIPAGVNKLAYLRAARELEPGATADQIIARVEKNAKRVRLAPVARRAVPSEDPTLHLPYGDRTPPERETRRREVVITLSSGVGAVLQGWRCEPDLSPDAAAMLGARFMESCAEPTMLMAAE
jgi:hypothetical protein